MHPERLRPDFERHIEAVAPLVLLTDSHHVSLNHPARSRLPPLQKRLTEQHTLVSPKPYINVSAPR